jgi:trimethylamine--corrinoid protein Co-methyltransferase
MIAIVHERSVELLADVGVCVPNPDIFQRLKKTGLPVENETHMVRFPPQALADLVGRAPKNLKLYARDGRTQVPFGDGPRFMGSGTPAAVFDLETGERRPSTRQDVIDMVRLEDAMPEVDIARPTMTATDAEGVSGLVEIAESFRNTDKHVVHRVLDPGNVEAAAALAAAVAGGEDAMRERPIFSTLYCPISPSYMTPDNVRCLFGFASHGIPVTVLSMAMGGASSPVTLLGELVVINAEVIGYIAAVQALYPGAPVMYGTVSSVLDMRTGLLPLGAPERGMVNAGGALMAQHYGLLSMCAGFSTDAKELDAQAGFEKALTAVPVLQAGADIIYGIASTDSGSTASFTQAVLDAEMVAGLRRMLQGIQLHDLDEEMAMIRRNTPRGNFLGERHTRDHFKSHWMPILLSRDNYATWHDKGQDLQEAVCARARQILDAHHPPALPDKVQSEIDSILARSMQRAQQS